MSRYLLILRLEFSKRNSNTSNYQLASSVRMQSFPSMSDEGCSITTIIRLNELCMKKGSKMSEKEKEKMRLLYELIKGSRRSDRQLAKVLKISQPTITRKRTRLEAEGYIKEYTIVPDVSKMGYEMVAFTFLGFTEAKAELLEKAREWSKKQPNIVFASDGEGLGMNSIIVSVHKNYASFSKLITSLRQDWQPNLKDVQSFILSANRPDLMVKQFSFRYLEKADN
jgi:DNA-binding Lrp family transcriptional regulator